MVGAISGARELECRDLFYTSSAAERRSMLNPPCTEDRRVSSRIRSRKVQASIGWGVTQGKSGQTSVHTTAGKAAATVNTEDDLLGRPKRQKRTVRNKKAK